MDTIETILKSKDNFDHKSILNKLNKKVNQSILDKIESGITIEELDNISKSGLPVLKYKTQITIHGLFPELGNNYIFGYKNIFQNKNKSIGIKYNAIDEGKRQRIAKRLNLLGFHYSRNSQNTIFSMQTVINKDNFETVKAEYLQLSKKINNKLYLGNFNIWIGSAWGCKYLCFDLYINGIYEKNVETFLNDMGATTELYEATKKKQEIEEFKHAEAWKKEKQETEARKQASRETKKDQLLILEQYPHIEKTNTPGKYILRSFDYDDNLIFKVFYIYLIKGKKKPRYNKTEFITVQEAINYKTEESFSDNIYNGKLTGYKIN